MDVDRLMATIQALAIVFVAAILIGWGLKEYIEWVAC